MDSIPTAGPTKMNLPTSWTNCRNYYPQDRPLAMVSKQFTTQQVTAIYFRASSHLHDASVRHRLLRRMSALVLESIRVHPRIRMPSDTAAATSWETEEWTLERVRQ